MVNTEQLLKLILGSKTPMTTPRPTYEQYLNQYGVTGINELDSNYDYQAAYNANVTPIKWTKLPLLMQIQDLLQMISRKRHPFNLLKQYMWPDTFKNAGHETE